MLREERAQLRRRRGVSRVLVHVELHNVVHALSIVVEEVLVRAEREELARGGQLAVRAW